MKRILCSFLSVIFVLNITSFSVFAETRLVYDETFDNVRLIIDENGAFTAIGNGNILRLGWVI